jgi:hypothetical protein
MIGDVILLKSSAKTSTLNLALQRLNTRRFAYPEGYTHVALGTGPFQAIHAMPAPWHVEIAALQELLLPQAVWQVWRNSRFSEKIGDNTELAFSYHCKFSECIGEAYNNRFVFRDAPDYSYCSQLVGKLAEVMGCPFSKPPFTLMPIDIRAEVERAQDWTDVTAEYENLLERDAHYQRLYFNPNRRDSMAHYSAYLHAKGKENAFNQGLVAMMGTKGPQSRIIPIGSNGATTAFTIDDSPRKGLHGHEAVDLPEPYHGSVWDWSKILSPITQLLGDDEFEALMSLEMLPKHRPQEGESS